MKNKQLNHKTRTEQNRMDFIQRTLTLLSFIVIVFSIGSCTHNQQKVEKELNVVERIGEDVSLYKFHHKYGTKRMGEVISLVILLIPFIAMQFTNEVQWTVADFIFAAGLLIGAGLAIEMVTRKIKNKTYKLILLVTIFSILILIWMELAVGLFGTPFGGN
ncbi:MAG: hypothetical protein V7670_00470 [Maribacter arcticus]|uniref:hypothetical protein n=2 Tax=Maribacter arcticus TaxID=561365 RepID=UPI0030018E27